jgi:alpha-beta hydrolase superfamily lysophospholipase
VKEVLLMAFINEELRYPSSNGKDTITAQIWYDDAVSPLGIVQIVHGMNEYMGRYEDFARFLTQNGFIVCGNDHTGHGKSKGEDGYGYFGDKDGNLVLVNDVRAMNDLIAKRYPRLGVVMLGHSMGSFICRSYITKYGGELSGIILSGTAGPNPLASIGLFLSRAIMLFKGPKHKSAFLNNMAFGHYNDRFEEKRTKADWLTRDTAIVDKYSADEMCTFVFTAGGYHDLLKLIKEISSKKWAGEVPHNVPYLVFSGSMDPVGGFTKGVSVVYDRLKAAGVKNITLKIYEGGRHEMLNDTEKATVYSDILGWINRVIANKVAETAKK